MKILVTGANGFVGSALIDKLLSSDHEIIALVRSSQNDRKKHKRLKWIEGDLLKPDSLPQLKTVDRAFYLVHGLKGESSLFEHQESLAAVNFINWLRPTQAGIIYLGGLGATETELSPHLRSRQLTGAILGSSGLPMIEFRASIILGAGSLSFEMVKALSERLPFRPDLKLLNQPCQPLAVNDLLKYLEAAMELPQEGARIFEIGGPEVTTYGELLDLYSDLAGLWRKRIKLPEVEPKVLMKAMDYVLPEYSGVGKKLTESLEFPTIVSNDKAKEVFPEIKPLKLRESMEKAKTESQGSYSPLWNKEFLRTLLSDKILTQSGLLSPELLKNLERMGKIKNILSRK